jgi:Arc/MetJ-type ribon-helix-helix transcriptional regulator
LREGIRLVEERRAERAAKLKVLRAAVRVGIEDFEKGNFKVFENGKELSAHLDKLSAKAIARKKAR